MYCHESGQGFQSWQSLPGFCFTGLAAPANWTIKWLHWLYTLLVWLFILLVLRNDLVLYPPLFTVFLSLIWAMICRAHSFPRNAAEFGFFAAEFEPRNLPRNSSFCRGIRPFAAEFDVFHSNNYFFTENDLKVALLQVCLWWFFVWWWWLNDEIDDFEMKNEGFISS